MGKNKHGDATSTITTRKDPRDGFTRTAIVVEGGDTGSIDLVTPDGKRVAQVNISYMPSAGDEGAKEECLIVDVIDVDDVFPDRRALVFNPKSRTRARIVTKVPKCTNLVSTDFRRPL